MKVETASASMAIPELTSSGRSTMIVTHPRPGSTTVCSCSSDHRVVDDGRVDGRPERILDERRRVVDRVDPRADGLGPPRDVDKQACPVVVEDERRVADEEEVIEARRTV